MTLPPPKITDVTVREMISRALQEETRKIVEQEAEEAAKRAAVRVREMTAKIASRVLEKFSFERFGSSLRIEVDFSGNP